MFSLLPCPVAVENHLLELPWDLTPSPADWQEMIGPRLTKLSAQGLAVQVKQFVPSGSRTGVEWAFDPEGYFVQNDGTALTVGSASPRGALYGLVSLGQIVRNKAAETGALGHWYVADAPRFAWRGIMIDSSRHFTDYNWLMDLLDLMTEAKLNVLHWHLTDDQGWRFAVPGWPLLTEKGAWRSHSEMDGRDVPGLNRDSRGWYGGWYTDEQIHALVEKARLCNILVVPEVDIPGHSGAALCAYPANLGCGGSHAPRLPEPPTVWGVLPHVLCPGKDSSLAFVKDVFGRLADLFPSSFLHLGGDEVQDISSWEHCPDCRKRMEELGLKSARDLEGWFVHECQKTIRSMGKVPLAWDDVIAQTLPWTAKKTGPQKHREVPKGLELLHPAEQAFAQRGSPEQLYHFWSNRDHLRMGLESGESFVFSPSTHIYLDMTYGEPEPKRWAGYIPVRKAWEAEPADFGMADSVALGVEAPLWTEHLPRTEDLDRLVWPRLLCVADVSWGKKSRRNWDDFRSQANLFLKFLTQKGVQWRRVSDFGPAE